MAGIPRLRDMVIVGQEDWDEVWRRNQFLIAGLARRFPAARFLFVELPFDLTYGIRSGQLLRRGSGVRRKLRRLLDGPRRLPGLPNIHTLVAPKFWPDASPRGERANAWLQAVVIRRAARRLGLRRPILWTQNPFAARLVEQLRPPGLVYDVTDDWTAFDASARFTARAAAGDALLTRRADVVIACSPRLYAQKRPQAVGAASRRVVLIPNGVDMDHYAAIGGPGAAVAPALAAIPRPILGYTGSVHESRLDLDLIAALAAARPHLSLVFIGPLLLAAPARARLARFSNVHLLGPVPYSRIPAYMQGCAALMIPHRVSAFTESLNPIKLFEYLAAGLPVVATPVAGVRDYAGVIRLASSPAAFIAAVDTAIAERAQFDRRAARRHAEPARWALRVDAVLAAIGGSGVPPRPAPGRAPAPATLPRLADPG